ncbi:type II toxin-antitoxin system PemK/MazF family toxin [Solwaraspora sp. WMMD1047]|uniref:type II toxin-antitoxin system PemK/MazF family toxin n=1 Tax=Solwaraspora sp. WMMD1047 TaxID=3016102 RepID=UPI002417B165|nr:type II toxin-antitoxin system PemK/MazF family toxin [Solwaraspora sp. WMMD1047]MDG4827935.1 type II toxin-antitoxin system PemK/MazF family toxin [Solwaraspora sp. WMMD1047]
MRRGDVFLADLSPALGSEADKRRPVIVVSNDAANRSALSRGRGVVTVIPVTSNTTRVYPFQVTLPAKEPTIGLSVDSKGQAEQIRSIDVSRLSRRLGALPPALLRQLDDALRLHLTL